MPDKKFFKSIKFKSIFQKLIASYIILTSLILLVSTIILYTGYKRQVFEQGINVSNKLLGQANYYADYTLKWGRSFVYQLYLDKDVYNLMYSAPSSRQDISLGLLKINEAASLVPLINSVYVYNNNSKTIYSSLGNSSQVSLFSDSQAVNILKNYDESFSSRLIPRKIPVGKGQTKNVLSIILTNNINADMPDGAIILNLDSDNVEDYFRTTVSQKDFNLFAINNEGKIVFNAHPQAFLSSVGQKNYIIKILQSRKNADSFIYDVDGKTSIVTYRKSDRLNLTFVSITPYETLLASIHSMVNVMIIMLAITFFIGIIFAYLLSKTIYSPIDRVVKYVKKKVPLGEDSGQSVEKSDIDYLSLAVEKVLNEPFSLKNLSKEDVNFIKYQVLEGLLQSKLNLTDDLLKRFKDLDINFDINKEIMVVAFKIDAYKEFNEKYLLQQKRVIKNKIRKMIFKETMDHYESEVVIIDDDTLGLILNVNEYTDTSTLVNYINEIQKRVEDETGISLSAGIGIYADLKEIAYSYKAANDCVNYRFKYGLKSILFYEKIAGEINEEYKYHEDIEQAIFNALKLGNLSKVENELNRMFDAIQQYSYSDMLLAITQLLVNSKKVINNLYHVSNENVYIDIRDFRTNLDKLETADEAKEWLMDLYTNTVNKLKDKRINRKNEFIESVQEYIATNYSDPLLSLESIAEKMNLSPNYLRVIFKEIVDKSISTYINELRFKKAGELLETTTMTAAEIATSVGFSNTNYFYTAFKKFYGVSPNQFRIGKEIKNN